MKQSDFFEETLEKKIYRMERWIHRLQKELWFLKEVHELNKRSVPPTSPKKIEQLNLFGT